MGVFSTSGVLTTAVAQPVGGSVIAGQAQISTAGSATIINQSSAKAILNWQDFSVAAGNSVQFNQPDSASITLNRVTGTSLSSINGTVQANGQVWILNPNGVLFGQGSSINVGGLLATTSDLANADFMAGRYSFSGGGTGSVINNGAISAATGGSVVLSAPTVINNGLIAAKAGHVVLGGADTFTVDFNGDHLLSYAVGAGTSGKVVNNGVIKAQGGTVLMTARAASGIADAVVNNTGTVEATSARVENGEVILDAGEGTASNSGTLDASGKGDGETGGSVQMLGKTVQVADGAHIDVSGDAGGGQVLVGGNFHGAGPQTNAQTTTVGKATIAADAITSGNGGKVAVWSDGKTVYAGAISAKGGSAGGNGGEVETSGHDLQVLDGAIVTAAAINGVAGNWLLDPHNILISNSGGPASQFDTTFTDPNGNTDININPASIGLALGTGTDVTLQANNDITIADSIAATGSTTKTLMLQAGRSIILNTNQSITYSTGNVVLSANDPGATGNRDAGAGSITSGSTGGVSAARLDLVIGNNALAGAVAGTIGSAFTPFLVTGGTPTYIKTSGTDAFVTSGNGVNTSFALGNSANARAVDLGAGSLLLTAGGVTQTAPIFLNNFTLALPASTSSGNPVLLTNTGNTITGTVNINMMGGSPFSTTPYVSVVNSQALTIGAISDTTNIVGGNGDRGNLSLQTTAGDLTLTGNIDASKITLTAAGSINQPSGRIDSHVSGNNNQAGIVVLSAGSGISLTNANNVIEQTVASTGNGQETAVTHDGALTLTAGGAAAVTFASRVDLNGASAGGLLNLTTTGSYNLSDAGGNIVKTYNNIDIYGAVSATGLLSLHASGSVRQLGTNANDVHLTASAGLTAISDNGFVQLLDQGHASIAQGLVDSGNQITGVVNLSAGNGNAGFLNNVTFATHLGSSSATGQVTIFTLSDLILDPGAVLTSTQASGDGVFLAPKGNFINNSGSGAVVVQSGARWLIFSNDPTNDVFGGLNSNNTAVYGWTKSFPFPLPANATGNRYVFAFTPTATFTPVSYTKTYGTVGSAIVTQVNGLQPGVSGAFLGDTQTSAFSSLPTTSAPGQPANAPVSGSPYTTSFTSNPVSINGYNYVLQTGTITVTPALLTYTANAASRTYGAANPALSGTVTGFVNGETQSSATTGTLAFTTPATASSNVGSYAINGTGLSAANYTFQQAQSNAAALTIGKASLLYLANAASKTYGAANPTLSGTVTGFVNGDTQGSATTGTLAFTTAATASSGVGSYAINGSGLTPNGNYTLGQAASNATALTINAAILSYNANSASRTYAAANPAFGGTVTGFVNGDTQTSVTTGSLNFSSPATPASGVGSYAINGSGLSASNYVFQQASGNATALTITPATLTYTADGTSRLYGAANTTFTGAVTGFVNNDTQANATTGTLSFTSPATTSSVVGSYAINGSGLSSGNYTFQQAQTNAFALTINQAAILYVANTVTRTYSTANPAITGTVTGFVNGDTQGTTTTGSASFSTAAGTGSNVGSYAITGTGLTVTNSNYALRQAASNATALTITPAILTYTAASATRVYGAANPAFSGTVSGFVNNDTQGSATSGTLAFVSQAGTTSNVGSYAINGTGLSAINYIFQQAQSNATALAITAKAVTVALQGTVSKFYDGTTAATLSAANYAVQGLVGSDSVSVLPLNGTYDTAQIGTGKTVTVSGLTLASTNYTLSNTSVTGAVGAILDPATCACTANPTFAPAVLSVVVSTQNSSNAASRPGALTFDTGVRTEAPAGTTTAAPTAPTIASLTPSSPSPIAAMVSSSSTDAGAASEPPTSSDQATTFVIASLEGGPPATPRAGTGTLIPGLLRALPPRSRNDNSDSETDLSGWGNTILWQ